MSLLPHTCELSVSALEDMARLASWLAAQVRPGDVVALDGPLGAGKTTFVQALARALGVQETVSSPTFVLMNEYGSGTMPVAHVDLYRLGPERAGGFAQELMDCVDAGQALVLVEWACYGDFLDPVLTWRLTWRLSDVSDSSEQRRIVRIEALFPLKNVFGEGV